MSYLIYFISFGLVYCGDGNTKSKLIISSHFKQLQQPLRKRGKVGGRKVAKWRNIYIGRTMENKKDRGDNEKLLPREFRN